MKFNLDTLKKRSDFLRARKGCYFAAPGLILQSSKSLAEDQTTAIEGHLLADKPAARFGFTATKKLGNAVVRNRVKRRLREAVRLIAPQLARPGYEYVLIGRKSTLKRPFHSLLRDLTLAFDKVHGKRVHSNKDHGNNDRGKSGNNRRNYGRGKSTPARLKTSQSDKP